MGFEAPGGFRIPVLRGVQCGPRSSSSFRSPADLETFHPLLVVLAVKCRDTDRDELSTNRSSTVLCTAALRCIALHWTGPVPVFPGQRVFVFGLRYMDTRFPFFSLAMGYSVSSAASGNRTGPPRWGCYDRSFLATLIADKRREFRLIAMATSGPGRSRRQCSAAACQRSVQLRIASSACVPDRGRPQSLRTHDDRGVSTSRRDSARNECRPARARCGWGLRLRRRKSCRAPDGADRCRCCLRVT